MGQLETIATVASSIIAALGLVLLWRGFRRQQFRQDEVLAWANEVIAAMQGLYLHCLLDNSVAGRSDTAGSLQRITFDTSILIERGRLFFKNKQHPTHGAEKPQAYRGYRPEILDSIVVAHQIAREWPSSDHEKRLRMTVIAEDSVKKFVSLAQMEVGRSRTASANTNQSGDGLHLRHLLPLVDDIRIEQLNRSPRT